MSDTKTVNGNIVHIQDKGAPTVLSVIANITPKQSGSGTPSPENVRAISGWESVSVYVTGKNILKNERTTATLGGVTFTVNEDKSVTANGTATQNVYFLLNTSRKIEAKAGVTYRLTGCPSGGSGYIIYNDSHGMSDSGSGSTYTPTADDTWEFFIRIANGTTVNNVLFKPMLRVKQTGDNDEYEPYNGTINTTALGRTVYGGTLDVISGNLTIDKAALDLGSVSWSAYGATSSYDRYITAAIDSTAKEGTIGICSHLQGSRIFAPNNIVIGSGAGKLSAFTTKGQYESAAAFKTAMNGAIFVYPLATPQTYTLTGQNVNLLKDCYAWADSGDISITYETYLINGLFHKIWINGVKMFAPNDFTLERSDVYAGEITTCTGKTIADRIGWKYADMSLNWDYLPQEYLETILNLSGVFTITFENEEGVQFTEQCIRKGSTMTGTRFTDVHGNMMWKGVQFDISFINVHN